MNDDELADFLESGGGDASGPGETPDGVAADHLRGLLADGSVWAEPRVGGADDLLAAIGADRPSIAAPGGPDPGGPTHARGRRRERRRPLMVALAAAAAAVVVVGVIGVVTRSADDAGREVDVAGTDLAPDASAVARVEDLGSGVAIELDVSGLPPAPPGTYYQGWVRGDDGLVTVGTFHLRGGDDTVELWSGVPLDRYPTLTVTLQDEGGGPASSGRVVLTGDLGG